MQQAPFLKPGDTIGIIAPSRKISEEALQPAIGLFQSWGLKVKLGRNLFAENNQFAGTDEQRRQDLQEMLDDPQVNAIICARGGYGTIRIMEGLKLDGLKLFPKWIIGYSDITVLHSYFSDRLNFPTIHAIMPVNYSIEKGETASWKNLKSLLFGELPIYDIGPHSFNRVGKAKGRVIGGNLSVLYSMTATPYDIDTTGCILFIEDLDEYLYHIDRMMMNLKLSGKLDKLAGLIVGGMSDMRDNTIPFGKDALEIIDSYTRNSNYPVIFNFPAGHIEENYPLILGKEAEIIVDRERAIVRYSYDQDLLSIC
jgi:muramoyltetrapeptide carboxypeptidase